MIGEGVETKIQLEQLKKLGCEAAQGFYFAKPMNFEDAKNFMAEKMGAVKTAGTQSYKGVSLLPTVQ